MGRDALLALALLLCSGASAAGTADLLAAADRAWAERSLERVDRLADPRRCREAIEGYAAVVAAQPSALEPRWKQLRALHFLVDFTTADEAEKEAASQAAMTLATGSLEAPGERDGTTDDRALLHFWSAIAWGTHGQRVGLLTLVREGVATRMRENAERAVALAPEIERGGAYRLLSRLHGGLPRVPFVSGWVDRDLSLPLAARAFAIDAGDPGNQLILAMALLEQAPERRAEAEGLLRAAAQATPREELVVEDLAIREQARERLALLE